MGRQHEEERCQIKNEIDEKKKIVLKYLGCECQLLLEGQILIVVARE